MSIAGYYHPNAFYLLPLWLFESGEYEDSCPGDRDDICITVGWFVWTLEVWL